MQTLDLHQPNDLKEAVVEPPAYAPPTVITYTDEQLLEVLGPAQAASYLT